MPIDFDNIKQPVTVNLKVVDKIPKNVSQKQLYTVKYTSNEPNTYIFHNVCARVVHYKKKYNKIIHYLYVTDAS